MPQPAALRCRSFAAHGMSAARALACSSGPEEQLIPTVERLGSKELHRYYNGLMFGRAPETAKYFICSTSRSFALPSRALSASLQLARTLPRLDCRRVGRHLVLGVRRRACNPLVSKQSTYKRTRTSFSPQLSPTGRGSSPFRLALSTVQRHRKRLRVI